jgi:DNA modification methylase
MQDLHAGGELMAAVIIRGDARHLPLTDASVDAIVTDPPYEIGFMARSWDSAGVAFDPATWVECHRVLKPGGHLLAFGGTRTYHRMACAIEDAGFEIRDSIHWVYGSGFPKSLDVGKAIDKAAGAEREVIGVNEDYLRRKPNGMKTAGASAYGYSVSDLPTNANITAPATPDAVRWQGWGTALKPAHEPIVVARKSLDGTVASNVLTHGTGALNIDACRTAMSDDDRAVVDSRSGADDGVRDIYQNGVGKREQGERFTSAPGGRWPTNLVFTHSAACDHECAPDCPVAELDRQSGLRRAGGDVTGNEPSAKHKDAYSAINGRTPYEKHRDVGGASRYFPTFRYEAKAPASERPRGQDGTAHVTVKPLALMRWLVRLITPPGGICLDPFLGSGTTAEACLIEGFRCVGVELDAAHLSLIKARLSKPIQPTLEVS